jgi:hypothetical protein
MSRPELPQISMSAVERRRDELNSTLAPPGQPLLTRATPRYSPALSPPLPSSCRSGRGGGRPCVVGSTGIIRSRPASPSATAGARLPKGDHEAP